MSDPAAVQWADSTPVEARREPPSLAVRGLVRTYESGQHTLQVLRGVDVDVRPGEIVALVGPSGSGKSSLLHAAGLLEMPTAGQVWIAGRECLALSDRDRTHMRRRHIGFIYQFHHLLPEFTALDNVAMPQLIAGGGPKEARERAAYLLDLLGLAERREHHPPQLSGGEQQRVAFARAVANQPAVLLADEPTGNLDPATTQSVFRRLRELVQAEGVAALVATHNFELARAMDRTLALRDGQVVRTSF